jgi:hypothetical protein
MPHWNTSRKARPATFAFITGVLVLWSTHAASLYEGDTTGEPGSGVVPCTAKIAYEAAVAAADAADAQYKKLAEPDWDKLSYKNNNQTNLWTRDESRLAEFLHNLKAELAAARQRAALAGNPNPEQADKNYQASKQRYDELEKQSKAKEKQVTALENDIKALMQDIRTIDAKLGATTTGPSTQSPEQKQRAAQIEKYRSTVASTQNRIQALVGTDDIDEARKRVANPNFKSFSNDTITQKRNAVDRAATNDEIQAAEGALDKTIENARQEAKQILAEYSTASRALTKLESSGGGSNDQADTGSGSGNEELRGQKSAKQKQIQDKIGQKAQLALQKPTLSDLSTAFKKMNAADASRTLATEARDLTNDLKNVEPWIQARLVRNSTEARMQNAKRDYYEGVKIKDSRLNEVRARFNELQSWINTQRDGLKGREQNEEYWKTVAALKSRASADYAEMEADLSGMDCFSDVANLLGDIRARRKNVEAIRIGTAVKKPVPSKKPPTRVASGNDISGWWVWLRDKDRVPMYINPRGDSGIYFGVYFPQLTTKTLVKNKNTLVVHINFKAAGSSSFSYRYKYPDGGPNGGIGGGTMTLSGRRMSGPWADDEGGARGSWTLERPTPAELTRLRNHFGRG